MSKVSVAEHLSIAKADIAAGSHRFKSAAEHIAAAVDLGATQRGVAETTGMSAASVNRLLKWRKVGFIGTPFGPDNVAKRARMFSQTKQEKAQKSEAHARADEAKAKAAEARAAAAAAKAKAKADTDTAKARARQARADADAARFRARADEARARQARFRIFSFDHDEPCENLDPNSRARLIKFLGMLGSDHDGERANAAKMADDMRKRLGVSWNQLIVKASSMRAAA